MANLGEIIRDKVSAGINASGDWIFGYLYAPVTRTVSPSFPMRQEAARQQPLRRGVSSLDARTADVLVSISYVRHTVAVVGLEG